MSRPPRKPTPVFVKRPPEQRRKLPPELEAFARSDEERLRIPRVRTDKGRVRDPREGFVVPGVANRDARALYDVRTSAMQALWRGGDADERALEELGQLLHDALRLELWRARRVTDFAAYVEDVVGMPARRAEELAEATTARTGESATPLTQRDAALWMRTEAGLYEGDEQARARIRTEEHGRVIEISVSLAEASTALAGAGARHLPLARGARAPDEGGRSAERGVGRFRPAGEQDAPRLGRRDTEGLQEEAATQAGAAGEDTEPRFVSEDEPEPADAEALPQVDASDDEAADERGTGELSEPVLDHHRDEADEHEPAAAAAAPGGARLLTRKGQPRSEPRGADEGESWGRRAPRAPEARLERDGRGERPRFERPRPEGGARGDRGRDERSYGAQQERRPQGGRAFGQHATQGRSERGFGKFGEGRFDRPRDGFDRGGSERGGSPRGGFGRANERGGNERGGFGRGGFGRGNERGGSERGGFDRGGFGRGNERGGFDRGGNERGGFGRGGDERRGGKHGYPQSGHGKSGAGEGGRFGRREGGGGKPAQGGRFGRAGGSAPGQGGKYGGGRFGGKPAPGGRPADRGAKQGGFGKGPRGGKSFGPGASGDGDPRTAPGRRRRDDDNNEE